MSGGMTVQQLAADHAAEMGLEWTAGRNGGERFLMSNGDGPGTAMLVGFMSRIRPTRIQIIGEAEYAYLSKLEPAVHDYALDDMFAAEPAAVVVADGLELPSDLRRRAGDHNTAIFVTRRGCDAVLAALQDLLSAHGGKRICLHGVMMEILGMGVLLTGQSGVGKSELALDLLSRGHRLIADDAPELRRVPPETLQVTCGEAIQDYMEVRGLGVINIRALFGENAVRQRAELQYVIRLESVKQQDLRPVDRLVGDHQACEILGIAVPETVLPVAPGRNLAILVECAVRNQSLKIRGYDAAEHFVTRQQKIIEKA